MLSKSIELKVIASLVRSGMECQQWKLATVFRKRLREPN